MSSKDIYRKDKVVKPLRSPSRKEMPLVDAVGKLVGNTSMEDAKARNLYRSREHRAMMDEDSHRRRSHRRAKRTKLLSTENVGAKVLWLSVLLLLLGYFVVLGLSMAKHGESGAALAAPAAQENLEATSQNTVETDVQGAGVFESIQRWGQGQLLHDRGMRFLHDGHPGQALEKLEAALALMPTNVDILNALSAANLEAENFDKAIEYMLKVLEVDPKNKEAGLKLARIYSSLHRNQDSIHMAEWLLETDPYNVGAHNLAGMSLLEAGGLDAAIPHLRKVVSIEKENIVAKNNLAVAYSRKGDFERAIELYQNVIDQDQTISITYYNLAVCYANRGDPNRVVDTLKNAASLFGQSFVQTWVNGHDFDVVRGDPKFVELVGRLDGSGKPLVLEGGGAADQEAETSESETKSDRNLVL